jgi:hypothetical protein
MDIVQIIEEKTFKPIHKIQFSTPPSHLQVYFKDGTCVQEKINSRLRLFLSCVKSLNYKRIQGDTSHCIHQETSLFKVLGFCSGDAIMFYQHDVFLFILFS